MRRIVYTIGEGLLVVALFTAALSAQNAMTARPAEAAVIAPPHLQTEGLSTSLPKWLNLRDSCLVMGTPA